MLILVWFCVSQQVDSSLSAPISEHECYGNQEQYVQNVADIQIPVILLGTDWQSFLLHPSYNMEALPQHACRKGQGQWLAALELILGTQLFMAHLLLNFLSRKYSAHPSSQETTPTASPEGQGFSGISKWFIGWWTHLESTSFLSPRCPRKHRSDTGVPWFVTAATLDSPSLIDHGGQVDMGGNKS